MAHDPNRHRRIWATEVNATVQLATARRQFERQVEAPRASVTFDWFERQRSSTAVDQLHATLVRAAAMREQSLRGLYGELEGLRGGVSGPLRAELAGRRRIVAHRREHATLNGRHRQVPESSNRGSLLDQWWLGRTGTLTTRKQEFERLFPVLSGRPEVAGCVFTGRRRETRCRNPRHGLLTLHHDERGVLSPVMLQVQALIETLGFLPRSARQHVKKEPMNDLPERAIVTKQVPFHAIPDKVIPQ
jgi:hypothetical protein